MIKAYKGQAEVGGLVKKIESYLNKPLDELTVEDVRSIRMKKLVDFPPSLEISVFYELTGRLPHEGLELDEERIMIHFYNTFVEASKKLFRKRVRYKPTFYTIC